MDNNIRKLIQEIHASPTMAVVAVAGAGAHSLTWLLGVAGASRTVLEALVPYASSSLIEFLGREPEQLVSVEAAREMARSAYQRAVHLRRDSAPVVGIACTAAIASDRPKCGGHRCYVAAWNPSGVTTYSLQFVKGLRDREGEDRTVSMLVTRALAEACGIEFHLALGLDDREQVETHRVLYEDPIQALLAGHVSTVTVNPDGTMVADQPVCGGVLPGSFNLLHQGHEGLACAASDILGSQVTYELSITNVDKPSLEEAEVRVRAAQMAGGRSLVITRALAFYEKARLFPGCTFVIGWDTLVRLVDPVYYGGQESKMLTTLEEIRDLGCRFLVAGRLDGGAFYTLEDAPIPGGFEDMFTPIPESAFRCDVSSTELRPRVGGRDIA